MQEGFNYLYTNSKEFELFVKRINKISSRLNEDKKIEYNTIINVQKQFYEILESYVKDMKSEYDYIRLNIPRIDKVSRAELLLAELFYKAQKYFFLNELFTYGFMEKFLSDQIKIRGLDVQETLLQLSNLPGTAIHFVYKTIIKAGFLSTPKDIKKFNRDYIVNRTFRQKVKLIKKLILPYFDKFNITNLEFYNLIIATINYNKLHRNKTQINENIDRALKQVYIFLMYAQRKLFVSQNLYIISGRKIYRKFPKLKGYFNKKPKRKLIEIYLKTISMASNTWLKEPNVFYKNHVINYKTGNIFLLNQINSRSLLKIVNRDYYNLEILELIRIIKELKNKKILGVKQVMKRAKYRFMLELGLACNLSCTMCFNRNLIRHKNLELNEWKKIIYSIPHYSTITFFGGEPFINKHLGSLLKFTQQINRIEKRHWSIECFTNGILTNIILKILKDIEPISIILSLDGTKITHERMRGMNTFDKTIDTIKKLKKETKHKIEVRSLITTINYKTITELAIILDNLKVDNIEFNDLHITTGNSIDKSKYVLSSKQRAKLFSETFSNLTKSTGYLKINQDKLNAFKVFPNNCGIGYNRIYVRCDGLVTGCPEIDITGKEISKAHTNVNGILSDPSALIPSFEVREFENLFSDCNVCGLLYVCGGGCRARAFHKSSDISKCDTQQRRDIEAVLDLMLKKAYNK